MRRLEGHGHQQRLARARRAFSRSNHGARKMRARRSLSRLGGPLGYLVLGIGIGASAFVLLDAIQQPGAIAREVADSGSAYYRSCRDAFQAGRANILRGEPGYRAQLDADGDGKACEPYVPMTR